MMHSLQDYVMDCVGHYDRDSVMGSAKDCVKDSAKAFLK